MTLLNLRTDVLMLSLFASSFCYSCKTTEINLPNDNLNQNFKIEGNWTLSAYKKTSYDKNNTVLLTDSAITIKGIDDDFKFTENRLLLKDKLIGYKINNTGEGNFLTFEIYDEQVKLKVSKINGSLMSLQKTTLSNNGKFRVIYYFQKD